MNEASGDFARLKKALQSFGPRHLLGVLIIVGALFGLQYLSKLAIDNVDRSDYRAVADQYIRKNAVIAKVLGKVSSVSHIGIGGDAGDASYNSFSIRGENQSGVCYCTLTRDENGRWYVTAATLTSAGREYSLPVKRTGTVPFKVFE